jgi:peroxiredoxin 2/4
MVSIGQKAPDFSLQALVGKGDFKTVSLSEYRGKWLVLFFYPLDFTSVCPTEIQAFSKREPEFRKVNAAVLGCSVDSVYAHKAWLTGTLGPINFPLLSDLTQQTARQYGALLEDKGYATRATFIIDHEGTVQYALYQNADVGRSVNETFRVLEALQTGQQCPVEWKRGDKTLSE